MTPCQTHQVILTVITDRHLVISPCQFKKKKNKEVTFVQHYKYAENYSLNDF